MTSTVHIGKPPEPLSQAEAEQLMDRVDARLWKPKAAPSPLLVLAVFETGFVDFQTHPDLTDAQQLELLQKLTAALQGRIAEKT